MVSRPTERQRQIASFLKSESRKSGISPTQREIAEHFGFASLNSVRSHLRLMEKKGMLNRLPGKARGLTVKCSPVLGIPLVGDIAAGGPQMAYQEPEEIVLASPELFSGSELFALRVKGDSMKDAGILNGDIAVINRQSNVVDGEIAAVLLDDEATLKYFHRPDVTILLRGANPTFSDIVISEGGRRSVSVLGKYVGLIRVNGGPS